LGAFLTVVAFAPADAAQVFELTITTSDRLSQFSSLCNLTLRQIVVPIVINFGDEL
jgi:hypothetical protein